VTLTIFMYSTGWRRCIGCLKLQVSFRTRATNYRALLWKMTSKDKASCGSSPPCMSTYEQMCNVTCIKLHEHIYDILCGICMTLLIVMLSTPGSAFISSRGSIAPMIRPNYRIQNITYNIVIYMWHYQSLCVVYSTYGHMYNGTCIQ